MCSPDESALDPSIMKAEILEFPCRYEIKAFGSSAADFNDLVKAIVLQYTEQIDFLDCVIKPSRAGRYQVVRCTVMARSREHLKAIYSALQQSEQVLTVL